MRPMLVVAALDAWTRVLPPLEAFGNRLLATAIGIAIFLVGWGLAALVGAAITRILRTLRFNPAARRIIGYGALGVHEPAVLAGWAARWMILLGTGVTLFDAFGFGLSASLETRMRDILPRILSSAVLFVSGSLLAMILGGLTRRFFDSAGLAGGVMRGRIVSIVLTFFAVLLAVEQLGFAVQFVMALGLVVVGAVGLAFALAFGLGSRDLAREFLLEFIRSLDESKRPRP